MMGKNRSGIEEMKDIMSLIFRSFSFRASQSTIMRHSDKCSTEESTGSCGTPKGRLSEKVVLPLTFENTSKRELDGLGERHF